MYTSGVYWSISKSPLMAKLRPGRVKIYYVKHFIFDEVVWLSRLVLQKKYINPLLPNGSPFEDLGPHVDLFRFWVPNRASSRSRLSAFVQISALFQIYITDMSRHLHHLTKCPFEVKKGLKGLFLHWEVIANKQTLPYFVLPSGPLVKYKIL